MFKIKETRNGHTTTVRTSVHSARTTRTGSNWYRTDKIFKTKGATTQWINRRKKEILPEYIDQYSWEVVPA